MKQTMETRLTDWRRIAVRLERLKACGSLDEAEPEMIAVLKFSPNLLLREQVLLHARHVAVPSDRLLTALLDMVCNRQLFVDERTLAAQDLGYLAPRLESKTDDQLRRSDMLTKLTQALALPEAQVFRQAVTRVIERIRQGSERKDSAARDQGAERKS